MLQGLFVWRENRTQARVVLYITLIESFGDITLYKYSMMSLASVRSFKIPSILKFKLNCFLRMETRQDVEDR